MSDKAPSIDEVSKILGKVVETGKEEVAKFVAGLPVKITDEQRDSMLDPYVQSIAARILEAFKPEIMAALAESIAKALKEGRGPTRKNPVALA